MNDELNERLSVVIAVDMKLNDELLQGCFESKKNGAKLFAPSRLVGFSCTSMYALTRTHLYYRKFKELVEKIFLGFLLIFASRKDVPFG